MKIHRVVTTNNEQGKSVAVSCSSALPAYDYVHIPGMAVAQIWSTTSPAVPDAIDRTTSSASIIPRPGETRFMFVQFPPDSVMSDPKFDPAAAGTEHLEHLPGLAELFEVESPGMHTTPTVDYAIVLSGEIMLELDGGQVELLRQHDVVVQNATRHAWRNPGSKPALMAFILIGAGA